MRLVCLTLTLLGAACGNSLTEGAYPGVPALQGSSAAPVHSVSPPELTGKDTSGQPGVSPPAVPMACTVTSSLTVDSTNTVAFYDPNVTRMQRVTLTNGTAELTVDNLSGLAGSVAAGSSQAVDVGSQGQCGVCVRGTRDGVAFQGRLGSATILAPAIRGNVMGVTLKGLVLVEETPAANTPAQVWCITNSLSLAATTQGWPCAAAPFGLSAGATQCLDFDPLKESHILSCGSDGLLVSKRTCDWSYEACKTLTVGGNQCVLRFPGPPRK